MEGEDMRPKGSPGKLKARRMEAARLLRQGESMSYVAHMIGASVSSVHRWKQALDQSGTEGLNGKRHPGPKPRLSPSQRKELKHIIEKGASASGFPKPRWLSWYVTDVIRRRYGVNYSCGTVGRLLRSLGLTSEELAALGFVGHR